MDVDKTAMTLATGDWIRQFSRVTGRFCIFIVNYWKWGAIDQDHNFNDPSLSILDTSAFDSFLRLKLSQSKIARAFDISPRCHRDAALLIHSHSTPFPSERFATIAWPSFDYHSLIRLAGSERQIGTQRLFGILVIAKKQTPWYLNTTRPMSTVAIPHFGGTRIGSQCRRLKYMPLFQLPTPLFPS